MKAFIETLTEREKIMTINEALKNIDIVVSGTRMTREEHTALQQSVNLIMTHINDLEKEVEEFKQPMKLSDIKKTNAKIQKENDELAKEALAQKGK
ncbi:hypothetical protein LCGC14_2303150 [marine sediment metagenome]|uniref:Uncharacterized protein n=1 Tax=marine sediment metagenome TaxID=412755 RepID=A0A0F9F076_9ZZZZ